MEFKLNFTPIYPDTQCQNTWASKDLQDDMNTGSTQQVNDVDLFYRSWAGSISMNAPATSLPQCHVYFS